jgi:uncharacterized protein (DUF2267 family)
MSQSGLAAFDSTIHTTNVWLGDVMERLGTADRHQAYQALRAVLHALRDRLTVEAAAALGAQLPMLVRGFYYEGWHPHGKPLKQHREEFLAHIAAECPAVGRGPEQVAKTVFRTIARHVTEGEIEKVKQSLPADLRELW